jgi:rod shape determining protein RodA
VGFVLAQVVVNAGMNLGLLPVIGITLPFVSSGGSSMLAMWIMTGLVASVAIRRPRAGTVRKNFEYDDDE